MNTFKNKLAFVLALVLAVPALTFAQATTTSTTFSVAVGYGDTQVQATSATGMSAPVQGAFLTLLYVDREAMGVTTVNGTVIGVQRGLDGTIQSSHNTTATVWVGPPTYFSLNTHEPSGNCTPSAETALPRFFELFGTGWTCSTAGPNANQWILEYPAPITYPPTDSSVFSPTVAQGVCHFQYNFAVDGGAIGTIIPKKNCTVPKGAIITGATMYASTAGTTSASGTLSVGVSGTGGAVNSFLAATAAASITGVLQSAVVPQTASGFIHLTTSGQGEVAIATGALTAGVLDCWLFYTVSPL